MPWKASARLGQWHGPTRETFGVMQCCARQESVWLPGTVAFSLGNQVSAQVGMGPSFPLPPSDGALTGSEDQRAKAAPSPWHQEAEKQLGQPLRWPFVILPAAGGPLATCRIFLPALTAWQTGVKLLNHFKIVLIFCFLLISPAPINQLTGPGS